MINSTFVPQRWQDVEASKVQPSTLGVAATITAQTTQSIDTLVADDSLIRAIEFLCRNQAFGDTISVSVVDVNGVYVPAGTVISTPVSNYNIVSDRQSQRSYEAAAPLKIRGGLFVRVTYVSTGATAVDVGINFLLLKLLV